MIDGVAYTDGRQNSRSRNVLKLYRVPARAGAAKANSPQRHGEAGGPEVWAQPRDPGRKPVRAGAVELQYKTDWRGGLFYAVPAQNTSRTCPVAWGGCGQVSADNRKTQAKFVPEMRAVSQCGFHQCGKYPRGVASLSATLAGSKCVVAGTTEGIHRLGVEPVGIPGL